MPIRIQFKEPNAPKYIYIHPRTNRLHLMMPIIGGIDIATDNTCQTMNRLKTFFGYIGHGAQSILHELRQYEEALNYDIYCIHNPSDPIQRAKEVRLGQVRLWLSMMNKIMARQEVGNLGDYNAEQALPAFLNPLLSNSSNNNLYSIRMCPTFLDGFLYTRPEFLLFSVDRRYLPTGFYTTLRRAVNAVMTVQQQSTRVRFLNEVSTELGRATNDADCTFEAVKEAIQCCFMRDFGKRLDGIEPVSKSSVWAALMLEPEEELAPEDRPTVSDYFDTIIGLGADSIFEQEFTNESPFNQLDASDQSKSTLIVLTQFFLAQVNIYCKSKDMSTGNFGFILDSNGVLQNQIATAVTTAWAQGTSVERALLACIERTKSTNPFGLNRSFSEQDKLAVISTFAQQWNTIKDSPHFDEFFVLDKERAGYFKSHQGSICVDMALIAENIPNVKEHLTQSEETCLDQAKTEYTKELMPTLGSLAGVNESVVAFYEMDNDAFVEEIRALMDLEASMPRAIELLFAKTNQENRLVFSQLTPTDIESIKRCPAWREFRRFIAARVQDRNALRAFNAHMSTGDTQIALNREEINALYIAAIEQMEPSELPSQYATNISHCIQLLSALGVDIDENDIELNAAGDFVMTCPIETAGYLRSAIIPFHRNKLYVNIEMAQGIYTLVKRVCIHQERQAEYDDMNKLNNHSRERPAKMCEALRLLDIHIDHITYPNVGNSVEGYIFQAPLNSFEVLAELLQSLTQFHLTPDMAGGMNRLLNAVMPDQGASVNTLSNRETPAKLTCMLQLLGIPVTNITFHGFQGYNARASLETQALLNYLKTARVENHLVVIPSVESASSAPIGDRFSRTSRNAADQSSETPRLSPSLRANLEALNSRLRQLRAPRSTGLGGRRSRGLILEDVNTIPTVSPVAARGLTGHGGRRSRGLVLEDAHTISTASPVAARDLTGHGGERTRFARTRVVIQPLSPVALAAMPAPVADHISIEPVAASIGHVPEVPDNRVELRCSEAILSQFRHLLSGSPLLGTHYLNPYTQVQERFPMRAQDLTARHLQLLARIESVNTTGIVNFHLYAGLLPNDTVAAIRCLVKGSTVAGLVQPTHTGGYHSARQVIDPRQQMIVVDQSGLQWQRDFRNTGGMFFYPNDPNNARLNAAGYTQSYTEWQNAMFSTLYGIDRPASCSANRLVIIWRGVPGQLDLNQVSMAIASEFRGAWDAVVSQGDAFLDEEARINFKFLKAGMGFFAEGLNLAANSPELIQLELARLSGILQALTALQRDSLGKIRRLELPFSDVNDQGIRTALGNIRAQCTRLGLEWGGTPTDDALAPRVGYVNATTNCGDPHAMIGNEGGHQSVDASIATNTPDIQQLNLAFNDQVNCVMTTTYIQRPANVAAAGLVPQGLFRSDSAAQGGGTDLPRENRSAEPRR